MARTARTARNAFRIAVIEQLPTGPRCIAVVPEWAQDRALAYAATAKRKRGHEITFTTIPNQPA